jgi:hypothetical protein
VANETDTQGEREGVAQPGLRNEAVVPAKRPRGRPRKIRPAETETPATVMAPVPETSENPVALSVVEELDSVTGEVIAEYEDEGADVDPELTPAQVVALDRDYDGRPGGSRPIAKLTDGQRNAYLMDAVDTFERQYEVKRTDGFNRVWTFRHETVKNHDHMLVRCERGPVMAQRLILTSVVTRDALFDAIDAVSKETER